MTNPRSSVGAFADAWPGGRVTRKRPEKVWSHRFAGMQPQILAAHSRVFVQLSDWDSNRLEDRPQTLHCLDTDGRLLWSRRDAVLKTILDDGCVVDSSQSSALCRLDDSGEVTHRVSGTFTQVTRVGGWLLLMKTGGKVRVTDLAFRKIARFRYDEPVLPLQWCRRGEYLYVVSNGGAISRFDRRGRRDVFAEISAETIEQTFADFERVTGRSACEGWLGRGTRPKNRSERDLALQVRRWFLSYDSDADVFLASSRLLPHLLVCFEPDGQLRWSRFLSPGCCGGPPKRLSNGLWAAGSGCGGIVSWIDAGGEIVHRCDGVGSEIEVIDGDLVLGQGEELCAYDAGKPVWHLDRVYSFAVSGRLLATVDEVDDEVEISAYKI